MNGLDILPSECDCEKCRNMCHGPCCGTVEEIDRLIDLGYANRLMYDDWPDGNSLIKPALKGYEGENAPWVTRTEEGCTFWIEGKCQLHDLGLKPLQGRLSHHSQTFEHEMDIEDIIKDEWQNDKTAAVIKKWMLKVDYVPFE